jgi:hypothetical protein
MTLLSKYVKLTLIYNQRPCVDFDLGFINNFECHWKATSRIGDAPLFGYIVKEGLPF